MALEFKHTKLRSRSLQLAALAAGLITVAILGSLRAADGSLSDSEIERSELKIALDKAMAENKQLHQTIAAREDAITEMRKNLAAEKQEGEVFKRQFAELKLKFEALGLDSGSANGSKLEQRLLDAVSDLRAMAVEKKKLSEALVRLADASSMFARTSTASDPESRVALEAELRNGRAALGDSANAVEATAVPATMTDAMAISVKDDLALVVMNLGSKQGVKIGMPFQVTRQGKYIGNVRVVDVREKIAGAVIQNLYSEKDQIKVGDHLKVDAQQ